MLAMADPADLDNGPRTKSGTERMCAVTRQVAPIDDLIRFVLSPTGEPIPDLKRKLPGRGLWVSLSHATVAEAARRNVFARSFKRDVQVSKTLADDVERLMVRGVSEALAMTAKAGQVVSGFSKVEGAIEGRPAAALIHATDGAPDGIRKLNARLAAVMRENSMESANLPVLSVLTTDELDLALGRANVVHAALLAGPA
ncbi:MAG TPA: RNA-binding protein, partial [Afipia sp.]